MNNPLGMLSQFLGAQNGMNPISIMTQLQKSGNPMQLIQQMFGNDPKKAASYSNGTRQKPARSATGCVKFMPTTRNRYKSSYTTGSSNGYTSTRN